MAAAQAARALDSASKASIVPAFAAVKFHLGTDVQIMCPNDRAHLEQAQLPVEAAAILSEAPGQRPQGFDGLWGQRLAEWVGEKFMPALEAVREDQLQQKRSRAAPVSLAEPVVPHVLPMTRWALKQDMFRSTLIAEDSATRKPARLSWYHPDDTMVPRGWWSGGLLADLKYYSPFGLGGKEAVPQK